MYKFYNISVMLNESQVSQLEKITELYRQAMQAEKTPEATLQAVLSTGSDKFINDSLSFAEINLRNYIEMTA